MTMLWAIPPAVLLLGAIALCVLARQAGGVMTEVRGSLDRMSEVHLAVARVHHEAAATRARLGDLPQP